MSKTVKMILIGIVAVLVLLGIGWKVLAPRVLAGVKGLLISQVNESINGRVEVATIDFSVMGTAVLNKVVLYNKAGAQVASSDEIGITYKFDDLLGGRFGIDSVKTVTAEKVRLKLGIDKNGRWSLEDLVKPQKERATVFRGRVVLKEADIAVTTQNWKRDFTAVSGELDYASAPTVAVDLKGKVNKSTISAKGTWIPDKKTQLALKIDTMELAEVQALLPMAANTPKLSSGTLKDVQGNVVQEPSGISMSGGASVSGMAVNVQGMAVKDGNGKLQLQGKKVTFQDASVVVEGNKMNVDGSIDFGPVSPTLALKMSSSAFKLDSLAGLQGMMTGTASFQADVAGTMDKPTARGSFRLPSGKIDTYPVTGGEGAFTYAEEQLTLSNANAKALGGSLNVSGSVNPKTSRYNLKVVGDDVDGAVLTDNGLSGRMDFNAAVTSQGKGSPMIASGTFTLPAGKVSEYAISNATGSFRKQGNRLDLSNVGLTMSSQRLAVSGSITLVPGGGPSQINLNISSGGLSTTAFSPDSALKGMVSFQANVTGTTQKNKANGKFQIASGSLGQLNFSGASGSFSYADGLLNLTDGRAQSLGGTITLKGTVNPKTMEYHQQVTGQNIDAAQLTDRDVQGRADFTAKIGGVGDWDKANADGNFKMKSGSVKNLSFTDMSGNFTKRGTATEVTNLKFDMLGGLASGSGKTEGQYLNLHIVPNATANAALNILTGRTLQTQDLKIRFRGPKG